MPHLSPMERKYLQRRLSQAYAYDAALAHEKDRYNKLATMALDTIENVATEASTVKRAVIKITDRIERTA